MAVYHDEVGPLHVVVARLVKVKRSYFEGVPRLDEPTGFILCDSGVVGRLPYGPRKAVTDRLRKGWVYVVHDLETWDGRRPCAIVTLYGTPSYLVAMRGDLMADALAQKYHV